MPGATIASLTRPGTRLHSVKVGTRTPNSTRSRAACERPPRGSSQ
jgi:hypothetical protein